MKEPTVSIWQIGSGKSKRWVCQVRLRPLGQKPISVQRRHPIKSVAYERAMDALEGGRGPQAATGALTVEMAIDSYLRALEGTIKDTTVGEYAYQLGRYFRADLASRRVKDISPDEIRQLLKRLLDRGLPVATANTMRTRICALYEFLKREQEVERNPAALVKPFRSSAGGPTLVQRPWDLEETRKALQAVEGHKLQLFLVLGLFTGLRRGEITALRWGDVDESRRIIVISKTAVSSKAWTDGELHQGTFIQEPKTRSSVRNVYCSNEVRRALYKARRRFVESTGRLPTPKDALIFKTDGSSYSPSSIRHIFINFCATNGLRKIRLHDLRHTSAVIALEAGIPLEAVSEGLGHSGVDITKRIYAPKVAGLGQRFANKLDQFISAPSDEPELLVEESTHA